MPACRPILTKVCVGTIALVVLLAQIMSVDAYEPECVGPYKEKSLTEKDLKGVIDAHKEWIKSRKILRFVPPGEWLPIADSENLSAEGWANLCGAGLSDFNLSGADLRGANLMGAYLVRTNLSDANLLGANLSGARLIDTNLSDARLSYAILDQVWFEPLAGTLPQAANFKFVNLHTLRYYNSPHALVELRTKFREAGLVQQERDINYAIKHVEIAQVFDSYWYNLKPTLVDWIDASFKWIFFELTTEWGRKPGRALVVLFLLIPLFAVTYVIALQLDGEDGIWKDWDDKRVRKDLGQDEPIRLRVVWLKALILGFYFSILSAFHIGWRDLNVGNWISRIQPREYTLRATGWIRVVSGMQSLISVYLIAIWALTYFGRPFG